MTSLCYDLGSVSEYLEICASIGTPQYLKWNKTHFTEEVLGDKMKRLHFGHLDGLLGYLYHLSWVAYEDKNIRKEKRMVKEGRKEGWKIRKKERNK